jgi:hypothetical protein
LRQHFVAGRCHQHVVLDTNADVGKRLGHPSPGANVASPARLSAPCRASSSRHRPSRLLAGSVMHIETEPMSGAMHKESLL